MYYQKAEEVPVWCMVTKMQIADQFREFSAESSKLHISGASIIGTIARFAYVFTLSFRKKIIYQTVIWRQPATDSGGGEMEDGRTKRDSKKSYYWARL